MYLKTFQVYIILIKMPFPLGWANSYASYARISYSLTSAPFFNLSSDVQWIFVEINTYTFNRKVNLNYFFFSFIPSLSIKSESQLRCYVLPCHTVKLYMDGDLRCCCSTTSRIWAASGTWKSATGIHTQPSMCEGQWIEALNICLDWFYLELKYRPR